MSLKTNDTAQHHGRDTVRDVVCLKGRDFSGFSTLPQSELLALADQLNRAEPAMLLKNSRSVRAGILGGFFIKRYNRRGFWHSLKRRFQRSRPVICRMAAERLAAIGIPTPEVLGGVNFFNNFLPDTSFLVTEVLPDDVRCLQHIVSGGGEIDVDAVARLLCKLHEAGCEHGDLSLRNIFELADGRLALIDLDSFRYRGAPLALRRRRRELARVISSHLRILRAAGAACDVAGWTERYVGSYLEATEIDLGGWGLDRRIAYLFQRERRRR